MIPPIDAVIAYDSANLESSVKRNRWTRGERYNTISEILAAGQILARNILMGRAVDRRVRSVNTGSEQHINEGTSALPCRLHCTRSDASLRSHCKTQLTILQEWFQTRLALGPSTGREYAFS